MTDEASTTRLLVVITSMAIGGPQKSLIGLFERLDLNRVAIDLLVLSGERGPLSAWLPQQVRVLATPSLIRAATLPRKKSLGSIWLLIKTVRPRRLPRLVGLLIKGLAIRGGKQRLRQHVWSTVSQDLPKLPGSYDAAIGILGLSTYAVVDLVEARFKYHWIRSDTRILRRDETLDGEYFRTLTGAVAVSQSCADIFMEIYPFTRNRVVVYKNDIPRGREHIPLPFDPTAAAFTLLTMSRLDRLKGIDLAIESCRELLDRGHDVQWVVIGAGPELASLQALIRSRGLVDRFQLAGSVLDTTTCLAAASIYVHPSRTEGRSNSVEEARAMGTPIVATAYATVGDQIEDGSTGLVCPMTTFGIATAVERLLRDPQLADHLGARARASYVTETADAERLADVLATGRLHELLES